MKTPSRIAIPLTIATAALSVNAHSAVLVGWDNWDDNSGNNLGANKVTTNFVGTIVTPVSQVNTNFGSNDGTFGTVSGASTGATVGDNGGPALLVRANSNTTFTLSLTNNTGVSFTLQTLNFDFAARSSAGVDFGFNAFTVTYNSGGLGPASTQVASASDLAYTTSGGTGKADHPDFDFNLADNLTDLVLDDGESALFTFQFSGQSGSNGGGVSSIIDNIAITGVPEPSTALLGALGCLALLRRRR